VYVRFVALTVGVVLVLPSHRTSSVPAPVLLILTELRLANVSAIRAVVVDVKAVEGILFAGYGSEVKEDDCGDHFLERWSV